MAERGYKSCVMVQSHLSSDRCWTGRYSRWFKWYHKQFPVFVYIRLISSYFQLWLCALISLVLPLAGELCAPAGHITGVFNTAWLSHYLIVKDYNLIILLQEIVFYPLFSPIIFLNYNINIIIMIFGSKYLVQFTVLCVFMWHNYLSRPHSDHFTFIMKSVITNNVWS